MRARSGAAPGPRYRFPAASSESVLLAAGILGATVMPHVIYLHSALAGQVVMQGFVRRSIPLFLRRAITMAPAMIVLAVGLDPSRGSSSHRWRSHSASRSRSCRS